KREGGLVRVVDFKTGKVLRRGRLAPHLAEQLLLYALVVRELSPGAPVELVVRAQREHPIAADDEALDAARSRLLEALEGLPAGATLEAESLSRVGPACAA